uniref:Uncharacterized protein n=1 Tax=Knipowitschia caucasica TaxID=637954 RepID=A0AAV2LEK3_KNICA
MILGSPRPPKRRPKIKTQGRIPHSARPAKPHIHKHQDCQETTPRGISGSEVMRTRGGRSRPRTAQRSSPLGRQHRQSGYSVSGQV